MREINAVGFFDRLFRPVAGAAEGDRKNQVKFDLVTLRAKADEPEIGGDYYGRHGPAGDAADQASGETHTTLYNTPTFHPRTAGRTSAAGRPVRVRRKQPDGSVERTSNIAGGRKVLQQRARKLTGRHPEFTMACSRNSAGTGPHRSRIGEDQQRSPSFLCSLEKTPMRRLGRRADPGLGPYA